MEEKVLVRGRYDPQYAVIVNHEDYTPVIAAQVQLRNRYYLKDVRYAVNKRVDRDAIDFAVRHLKKPFFVIPDKDDLVSNSGMHSVRLSDTFMPARGLYILEKELEFPRPRPKIGDLEKLEGDFIAWIVGEDQVDRLWLLKYVGSPDHIELTIPNYPDIELKQLQGNLHYTSIEIDEGTELPQRTKFRIFNHELRDIHAVSFVHDNGVYAIVHNTLNTCIHSNDHATVTLKSGMYLLYHPLPRRGID